MKTNPPRPLKVEDACDYVRAAGSNNNDGGVHLAARVFIKVGRGQREPGEFFCNAARSRAIKNPQLATRREFQVEPCPLCLEKAEKFQIEVGSLWTEMPGPWVPVYTTSPARRDRPYARGGTHAGYYRNQPVRKVLVPLDLLEKNLQWCRRDQYYAWDETTWLTLLPTERAEKASLV